MGIQGLLAALEQTLEPVHVKKYARCKVGVDMYAWLHRGAYMCSTELCLDLPAPQMIHYCMTKINMLLSHGVIPVCVFDGAALPGKLCTEERRAASRQKNMAEGVELLRKGQRGAAAKCFQKAVDITPYLASQLIECLRQQNVEFIVAPYEADAQLAFLSHQKYVACVISEDSDLIVFGCTNVLYKMDASGMGREFRTDCLKRCSELPLTEFDSTMFRLMCILSGCDYLPSIHGVGLKIAHGLVSNLKVADKILRRIRLEGKLRVPQTYDEQLKFAELTFLHQRVWDPTSKQLVHLTPLTDESVGKADFLGPFLELEVAQGIAEGLLHPTTQKPYEPLVPDPVLQDCRVAFLEGKRFRTPSRNVTPKPAPVLAGGNTLTKFFQPISTSKNVTASTREKLSRTSSFAAPQPVALADSVVWCSPYFSAAPATLPVVEPPLQPPKRARSDDDTKEICQSPKAARQDDDHLEQESDQVEFDYEEDFSGFESPVAEEPQLARMDTMRENSIESAWVESKSESSFSKDSSLGPSISRAPSLVRSELIHVKEGGTFKLEVFSAESFGNPTLQQHTNMDPPASISSRTELVTGSSGGYKLEIFS